MYIRTAPPLGQSPARESGDRSPTGVVASIASQVGRKVGQIVTEHRLIVDAIQSGNKDEDKLTNLVFHQRHPELHGRRIRRSEDELKREWRSIRRCLVPVTLVNQETRPAGTTACMRVARITFRNRSLGSNSTIWGLPGEQTLFFQSGLQTDADGAPNAYNPQNTGIDFNANGGIDTGKYYGIVTDSNKQPVTQKASRGDPFPGYYISKTSLQDASKARIDPARYVDSTKINYIALPPDIHENWCVKLGDFVAVYYTKTRRLAYAIYADNGPAKKLGEGSIALFQALGHNPYTQHGALQRANNGIDNREVLTVLFPGSGNSQPRTAAEINTEGNRLFTAWGGLPRLLACFP